jgi:uncharacterized protein YcfJ
MPKIRNINLANTIAGISTEMVKFDKDGIGEVSSQEVYEQALKIANFFEVEPTKEEIKAEEEEANKVAKEEEAKKVAKEEEIKPKAIKKTPGKK